MDTMTEAHQPLAPQFSTHLKRRNRQLSWAVVILGVAVLALGASTLLGNSSDGAVDQELQQVLDDYMDAVGMEAGVSPDRAAFEAVVTEDFTLVEAYYRDFGGPMTLLFSTTELDRFDLKSFYQLEEQGEPIVAGDGPWFVSAVESWSVGSASVESYVGTATYVIVDDDGTLRIADKYWVGLGS